MGGQESGEVARRRDMREVHRVLHCQSVYIAWHTRRQASSVSTLIDSQVFQVLPHQSPRVT